MKFFTVEEREKLWVEELSRIVEVIKEEYRGNVLGFFVFETCKMLVNGLYFGIDQ